MVCMYVYACIVWRESMRESLNKRRFDGEREREKRKKLMVDARKYTMDTSML